MTISEKSKSYKNIKAIFILWAVVSFTASFGGCAVFTLAYVKHPEMHIPIWELGKAIMMYGIINIGIMISLIYQFKKK